jgi:hypothetical protein
MKHAPSVGQGSLAFSKFISQPKEHKDVTTVSKPCEDLVPPLVAFSTLPGRWCSRKRIAIRAPVQEDLITMIMQNPIAGALIKGKPALAIRLPPWVRYSVFR